jgi:biotin carboxyl carrier protein
MIANMVANLEEAGKPELMDEALKEVPNVEADLGYPPLLTPLSQIVGVQATLNVISGERYKIITRETRDYVTGKYGIPPGPINEDLMRKIMGGDEKPDYSIRAGDLADPEDWNKAVETLGPLAKNDEDILLAVLFPMQAKELLTLRESGELAKAHAEAIPAPPSVPGGGSAKAAEAPAKPAEPPAETPAKPAEAPAPPPAAVAAAPAAMLSAPVEFDAVLHGEKFHVLIAGVGEPPVPGGPIRYFIKIDGRLEEVEVRPSAEAAPDEFDAVFHGERFHMQVAGVGERRRPDAPRRYFIRVDGRLEEVEVYPLVELAPSAMRAASPAPAAPVPVTSSPPPQALAEAPAAAGIARVIPKATEPGDAVAPMAGRVARVLVKVDEAVKAGQTVVVVEAMKLESEVQAPIDGVVQAIFVEPGDSVTPEDALVRIV